MNLTKFEIFLLRCFLLACFIPFLWSEMVFNQYASFQGAINKTKTDSISTQDPKKVSENLPERTVNQLQIKGKDYYSVILVIPSTMIDSDILIDDKPAIILDRKLTLVTIRVMRKETNHKITIIRGDAICTKELLINENNQTIQPCY